MSFASLTQVRVRPTLKRDGAQPEAVFSNSSFGESRFSSDSLSTGRFSDGRRALVLTDEEARHPFRASLPAHVREDLHHIPAEALWQLTKDDVRGAATTYVAATAAILAFII